MPEHRERVRRPIEVAPPLIHSAHQQVRVIVLRRDLQQLTKRLERVFIAPRGECVARRFEQLISLRREAGDRSLSVESLVLISLVSIIVYLAETLFHSRDERHSFRFPLSERRQQFFGLIRGCRRTRLISRSGKRFAQNIERLSI